MAWIDDYLDGLHAQHPGYVILMRQSNRYCVYDQDADVMHRLLNWNIMSLSGHHKADGPASDDVRSALKTNGYAYKIIHDTEVIETYDPSKKKSKPSLGSYLAKLRTLHPGYVLLIQKGDWYRVWDQDADVMHKILNWNVVSSGGWHRLTGGPVWGRIESALRANGYAYKVIQGTTVVKTYDPPDFNAKLTTALNLPMDVVRIGSKVIVDIEGSIKIYEICEKENVNENKISYRAPIAEALLGHKCGETVVAKVPVRDLHIKILSLEN